MFEKKSNLQNQGHSVVKWKLFQGDISSESFFQFLMFCAAQTREQGECVSKFSFWQDRIF